VGESRDGVIIDCNGDHPIRARGTGSSYAAGSISVNSGSTAVTGVGTAWLASTAAGEYIRIGDSWHRVAGVVANDVLTLEIAYTGPNQAGVSYSIAGYLTDIHLENLTVQNYGGLYNTIEMRWALDCSVRNCRIQDTSDLALFLQNAHRVVATGNVLQYTWMGIRADTCSNCEFAENLCTNNTYGIFVENSAARITIRDNHCSNQSQSGISMNHADDCTVSGNACSYNSYGISVGTSSTAVAVSGNVCTQNVNSGILISNNENTAVTGNSCRGNGGNGIRLLQSHRNAVSGNVCSGNGGVGIWIDTSHRNAMGSNMCTDNSGDGIEVRVGDENAVVGNTSTGNGGWGIDLTFAGTENNIVGFNILTGNTSGAGSDTGTNTRQKGTNYPAF